MIRPGYLGKGDAIGIIAPAGAFKKSETEEAAEMIRSWGLKIVPGRYMFRKKNSFAGTDEERAADLQSMLDNPSIKAIICARGGYGTIRIINRIDFTGFTKNPKWLVGYSDITVLHAALQKLGFESIHGPMPRVAPPKAPGLVSFESLRALLFGELKEYTFRSNKLNRTGRGRGILTGGNLSVLHGLAGTPYDIDTRGKILLLEDVGEYLYHIDRMMMNLKLSGKLEKLAGLIVGDMSDMKATAFRTPAYQIIREAVAEYDFPVMFGFPAGHGEVNLALPMGREISVGVSDGECVVRVTSDE